jgi:hypothetical protein
VVPASIASLSRQLKLAPPLVRTITAGVSPPWPEQAVAAAAPAAGMPRDLKVTPPDLITDRRRCWLDRTRRANVTFGANRPRVDFFGNPFGGGRNDA